MIPINSIHDTRDLLLRLGYHETGIPHILNELNTLLKEIDFDNIKQAANSAIEARDTNGFINSLKDLMLCLENKGYYRPDTPVRLIKHLVNGLDLKSGDIFDLIEKSSISGEEKRKEQEFLASCAAITQLGYILLSRLVPEVKAASSGPHVFIITGNFSPDSMIFVDFSIDSIVEVDISQYQLRENYYYLKNSADGLDDETSRLLTEYYPFFHITSNIGLSHNIHNNLGIAYDILGRYEEATSELKEALRLDPAYIEVHNNLAVTYSKMELFEEAIWELKEAIRLKPEYTEAHSNLGNIYAGLGRYEEAIGEINEAIRLKPEYALAHMNLGNIYALQKRNQEAIEKFQQAIRLNPDYAPAYSNLGEIYLESGMYKEALKEFQEALRFEPESSEAYHGLGSVYYSLGSYERSINAWIRAVYLNPELLECVPEKLCLKVKQGVSRLRRY